jgi:hypothetical protein
MRNVLFGYIVSGIFFYYSGEISPSFVWAGLLFFTLSTYEVYRIYSKFQE